MWEPMGSHRAPALPRAIAPVCFLFRVQLRGGFSRLTQQIVASNSLSVSWVTAPEVGVHACFLLVHESRLRVCRPVGGSPVPLRHTQPSQSPSHPNAGRIGLRIDGGPPPLLTIRLSPMAGRVSKPGRLPGTLEGSPSAVRLHKGAQNALEPAPKTPQPAPSPVAFKVKTQQRMTDPGLAQPSGAGSLGDALLVPTSLSLPGSY